MVKKEDRKYIYWKGFLCTVLSATMYSIDAVLVKSLKSFNPIQISLYRFIGMFFMTMPDLVKLGENPFGPKDVRFLLIFRGSFAGIGLFLAYISYRLLPLGETFIIISALPISVSFTACIFLNEPCGIFQTIIIILTVTGILFTTKVPSYLMGKDVIYTTENIHGILAAFGVLFARTIMTVIVRKVKKVDHSIIMFNYCWISLIETLILYVLIADYKWPECGIQWIWIVVIVIINYAAQMLITISLKNDFAAPVSTIMAATYIILAFLWQILIFHDIPDSFTIAGAAIVTFCLILTSVGKWVSSLPENSSKRKRLRWMTA